jgi:hypothetical protein
MSRHKPGRQPEAPRSIVDLVAALHHTRAAVTNASSSFPVGQVTFGVRHRIEEAIPGRRGGL